MNKEKFLNELKRTRSQAESLMYSLHYLLEETVYDARDYVDNELMKPIFDELDNQEQAVMNGEVSDSRRVKDGKKQIKDSDYTYDTVDYKGYTIRIEYDNDYSNPFEEWDEECQIYNVGHRNFGMGKDIGYGFDTDEEAREYFGDAYYLPFAVNGYDDSCYETSVDRADGFLVWERAAFEHLGTSNTPEQDLKNSLKLLNDYATGKVFGFIIERPEGGEIDSCWGFFGEESIDEMIDEAKVEIDSDIEQNEKNAVDFWNNRDNVEDSIRKRNVK